MYFRIVKKILLFTVISFFLFSCERNNVFDKSSPIPGNQLTYKDSLAFQVQVTDTLSEYNVYVNLRHLATYPYSNMWIKLKTISPDGKAQEKDLSLPMADEFGKWYGTSVSDIVDQKILIQPNASMPRSGTYTFILFQNSRDSIVTDLLDMGVRLERISKM